MMNFLSLFLWSFLPGLSSSRLVYQAGGVLSIFLGTPQPLATVPRDTSMNEYLSSGPRAEAITGKEIVLVNETPKDVPTVRVSENIFEDSWGPVREILMRKV